MALESAGMEHVAAKAGKATDMDPQLAKLAANHTPDHPDDSYINAVKAKLSKGLDGKDQIGQDSDQNGTYKGKSLELGKGGRALMMEDRISLELVNKGYALDHAKAIANKQMKAWAEKKYGPAKMQEWSAKGK